MCSSDLKSSLINEILYKAVAAKLNHSREKAGKYKQITGLEHIDKVVNIDQSPIGRTPRSNPATYTGVFDFIRDVFAETQESKARGYKKEPFGVGEVGRYIEFAQGISQCFPSAVFDRRQIFYGIL